MRVDFETPRALVLLWILPLPALLGFLRYRKSRAVLALFARTGTAALGRELRFRYFLSLACFLVFLACLVVALAGPSWGFRQVPYISRGLDVVLAFDLSRSMEVRDAFPGEEVPSRLERAAALGRELVSGSAGEVRFGVAIGKGRGVLAIPLTGDAGGVLTFLEGLSGSVVTGRGTNLESLLEAASGAFKDAFPTRRWIILFSDGEGLSGSLDAAVDKALEGSIAITAVGLGSETGGPVPGTPARSFLRDEVLRNAAERTGGIYLAGNRENAAAFLLDHIAALPRDGAAAGFKREAESRRHIFILLAIGALGLSKLLEKRRSNHEKS